MSRQSSLMLQFLTYSMLFGVGYAIIGHKVKDVKNRAFPYVVSISGRDSKNFTNPKDRINLHICTGTLIRHKSVLTAAHCLVHKSRNNIEIIAGSTNLRYGERYYPESWITFDQWNQKQKAQYPLNNIAVIILQGEGITKREIYPIPVLGFDIDDLDDEQVRILGWGKLTNDHHPYALKTALLKAVSNEECSNQGTMLKGKKFTVPPNYFCSKANPWVVSTPGDGGAPILDDRNRLVGINIGVCPRVDGYPQSMLNQLQMNTHLRLYVYSDFLTHVMR